ncbi:MAG: hypothetical protein ACRDPJ_07590 [Nocardioidaceae bacterium]
MSTETNRQIARSFLQSVDDVDLDPGRRVSRRVPTLRQKEDSIAAPPRLVLIPPRVGH